ncbi:uncharacterized protein LOC131308895 [Rhododendron vialii]|uniref:uncharacterized protein LOC131308895 n=1 Tax=Rhododendron vialii TaxID=182163 RepID=UPI00265D9501|nr:uncharacterized protein LOC131308895 [Rhododendron vialii]
MMESTPTFIPPLLLRNILTTLFLYADKPLLTLSQKYKLLHFLRALLISSFLFLLRLLPSLLPPDHQTHQYHHHNDSVHYPTTNSPKSHNSYPPASTTGANSGIARALSQLLSIVNDIPVSSRKYELVRSLAERIIDENLLEGSEALIEVNCSVLSAAFSRTLGQLEAAVLDRVRNNEYSEPGPTEEGTGGAGAGGENYRKVSRVFKAVRFYGDAAWNRLGRRRRGRGEAGLLRTGGSAEKLAAEVLWLAQKMAACGCVEEAVVKWASATHLAWLGLSAEPRLQGSLVKVSAFLFKQAKNLGVEEGDEGKKEQQRQTKMRMLMSWLPLLCRASNGTDAPVLSISERAELERVLEETIETLEQEEEQEKVLSLWLHHYTYCPSSDWPNLRACYARWCSASRKLLLLH